MFYIWKERTYIMAELIFISFVLIYWLANTLYLTASQCSFLGLCMNYPSSDTEYAISGHVPMAAYIKEPMASLYGMLFISFFSA